MILLKKVSPYFWVLSRCFVGLIFVYAGFSKLTEPIENFQGVLSQYPLVPYPLIPLISVVVPWFELISGLFLIMGYAPRLTAAFMISNVLCFLVILGWIEFMGGEGPSSCGCFGESGPQLTPRQMFYLDLTSFFLLLRLTFLKKHAISLDNLLKRP